MAKHVTSPLAGAYSMQDLDAQQWGSARPDGTFTKRQTVPPTRTERGVAMVLIELEKKKLANLTFFNLLKLVHFIEFQCWKIPRWSNFKPSPTAGSDPRRPRLQEMGAAGRNALLTDDKAGRAPPDPALFETSN